MLKLMISKITGRNALPLYQSHDSEGNLALLCPLHCHIRMADHQDDRSNVPEIPAKNLPCCPACLPRFHQMWK